MTRHGDRREWRLAYECDWGSVSGGFPVAYTWSVYDQWCEHCQQWIKVDGVIGAWWFMAEHTHGQS